MKKNTKGFTLIELLVVIAIIGLLSTLAVVSLNSARLKARDARRQSDLKQISTAMELYYSQNNAYPTNDVVCTTADINGRIAGVEAAGALEPICTGVSTPIKDAGNTYLAVTPADPTQATPYIYQYEGSATTYCVQAVLEGTVGTCSGTHACFLCVNGSCYLSTAAGCTAV